MSTESAAVSPAASPAVTATDAAGTTGNRLADLPISVFATVMGLAGLTLATLKLEAYLGGAHHASLVMMALTLAVFIGLAGLYGLKALRWPAAVRGEWHHPVKIAFFPTISISLLLIGTALQPFAAAVGVGFWAVGAALHLLATLAIVSMWIAGEHYEAPHMNPAWFIPAVGNVLVPLVGAQHGYVEVSWFFLSVGLVFWLVLLTIVFNRLVFHHPMPPHLLPTICILIAPPAVAFLAYTSLAGALDGFARLLYYPAIFFFLLVVVQLPRLARLAFALSWWAYSFPVAALTVATFVMAEGTGEAAFAIAAMVLYGLLLGVVVGLAGRTVVAVRRREICRPHP